MTETRRSAPLRATTTDEARTRNGSSNGRGAETESSLPAPPPGPDYWLASDGNWYPPQAAQQPAASNVTLPLRNGAATVALVCGIVGVIVGLVPLFFFGAWLFGALAFVFGLVGRSRAKRLTVPLNRGRATAGVVLGVAALVLGGVGVAIMDSAVNDLEDDLASASEWGNGSAEHPAADDVSLTECQRGEFGGVSVTGTITNHSSERSNYLFSINVVDGAGTKIAETGGIENNIDPGQNAIWEAMTFLPDEFDDGAFGCSVVDVTRIAAG